MRDSWNVTNHHFYGGFNFSKCRPKKRSQGGGVGCCGQYPNRNPFDASTKKCCMGKITNWDHECPDTRPTDGVGSGVSCKNGVLFGVYFEKKNSKFFDF